MVAALPSRVARSPEAEWNDFLLSDLLTQCPDVVQSIVRSQMRTDHDIVLTRGNLVGVNIIVRDGRIAFVVDWERAGFYPEYYELIKLLRGPTWEGRLLQCPSWTFSLAAMRLNTL